MVAGRRFLRIRVAVSQNALHFAILKRKLANLEFYELLVQRTLSSTITELAETSFPMFPMNNYILGRIKYG
jgi:hypothetical protein